MNLDHLTEIESAKLRHAKAAARVVGLILPLGLTFVGAVLYLLWMPRLPNPMAVHWGLSGLADGFESPWFSFVMFPIISLLITSMYFLHHLMSMQGAQKPGAPVWGPINRMFPAIILATVVLIFTIEVGTTVAQLDLADASDMDSSNPTLFAAFGCAIVVGVIAYLVQPKLRIEPRIDADAGQPLVLAETERVVWLGVASASRVYWWIVAATNALMFGSLIMMFAMRPFSWAPVIIMAATFIFVALFTLVCARFTVSIDESGLRAEALTRWPAFTVPAAEVERVEVGEINPFGEFGGWGLRWTGGGQTGIVLRTGEGIRILRKNGKRLVITLDDADGAAAVLSTAARAATQNTGVDTGPDDASQERNK